MRDARRCVTVGPVTPTAPPTTTTPPTLADDHVSDIDARHVWHPYSGFDVPGRPVARPWVVREASGVRLHLADGRSLIDGMSSWWAAVHGYRHPVLDAAVTDQLGRMSHVMFGGLTHEPAARLAELLVTVTPDGLDRVFFCDSGSVSVEVAVKMCLQYWRARGRPEKRRLLTWRGGYHGDTFTPMSVCDPEGGMHAAWSGVLTEQIFVDAPPPHRDDTYADLLTRAVHDRRDEIAAVIVEPVVQGAGGMRFHDPSYLATLRRACDDAGVLLIFDEIATGFGRTGTLFAADAAGVTPDVLCVGKALTGGYLSLAATLCTAEVATTISAGPAGGLMHGPTFMANPLACAVAVASTELLLSRDWRSEVALVESELRSGLEPALALAGVRDVRAQGAIAVVEMETAVDVGRAAAAAAADGVWLRPFRNLVYAMPAYVCTRAEVRAIAGAMVRAAAVESEAAKS